MAIQSAFTYSISCIFHICGTARRKNTCCSKCTTAAHSFFLRIMWNFERQATNRSSAGFQCRICEHQTSDQGNFGSHFLNGKCAVYANFLKCCCEEYKIKAQIIPRRHCTPPSAIHESSHVSFEEMNERKSVQRKDWSKLCRTVQWYCSTFDQFVYLRFFRFETLRHMWHF